MGTLFNWYIVTFGRDSSGKLREFESVFCRFDAATNGSSHQSAEKNSFETENLQRMARKAKNYNKILYLEIDCKHLLNLFASPISHGKNRIF